jgi:suppressor of fused
MRFLRRRSKEPEREPEHQHDPPGSAPGWEAIDAALTPIYRSREPRHWGSIVRWRLGGPDPLDGLSAYEAGKPPHWHYITYGLSELYRKESDDPATSGWGFELTFRLARGSEDDPPDWVWSFLQGLARYVFETGNVFAQGHHMDLHGPIALAHPETAIRAIAFARDPQLPGITTSHGVLDFVQVVGLTIDEYEAAQDWNTDALLDVIRQSNRLLITDLSRGSVLGDGDVARLVSERMAAEGSSMSAIHVDRLGLESSNHGLKVELGALAAERLLRMLRGRSLHGREFFVSGEGRVLRCNVASDSGWHVDGAEATVHLTVEAADAFVRTFRPEVGEYVVPGLPEVSFLVEETLIRDQAGRVIERRGSLPA